jgi:hypothetical protein
MKKLLIACIIASGLSADCVTYLKAFNESTAVVAYALKDSDNDAFIEEANHALYISRHVIAHCEGHIDLKPVHKARAIFIEHIKLIENSRR